MMIHRIGVACAIVAGISASAARADDGMIAPGMETFKLNIGGIVTTNNTNLRLDGSQGRGTDIDLESITGVNSHVSSLLASGTWRFAPNHRIGIQGFQVDRDHTLAIDREITIGDTVIPVNTTLSSEAKTQFFIVDYQYSFVKNQNMEIAAVLGLYGANFKYKFAAANPIVDIDKSTTAPLPLIGGSVDFFLEPRWTVSLLGQGLKLKVGDVDGSMYHVMVTTDYMFARNWGVGLGYQLADFKADITKGDFRGRAAWRMDGYTAYLQARF
jgi:hypothetical protein